MRIYCAENYEKASIIAADMIAAQILLKPDSVLGLATGSTPIGAYKRLIAKYEAGELDFSKITTINLDEYKGLDEENENGYRYFMNHQLFDHVNLKKENTFVPDGKKEAQQACGEYEERIKNLGGIDMQLLGLGHNGHIGFNEPADEFPKETHCVDLSESTIEANARFFASRDEVPKQAYTMGIGSIMKAKTILIMACGRDKKEIVKRAFEGPICPQVPASVLQLHNNVILVGDEACLN
jgi:glucosamine-6-phosphate deaminase